MSALVAPSIRAGKYLLVFAWIVELCAASAGLLFAYLILFVKNADPQDAGNQVTLIIAAIPFVIVAIVELTKIPLVSACYFSTSRLAKLAFAFSLILVSLITFETFLNGFQQGVQLRLVGWKKIQKVKKATEVEIKALEEEEINLGGLTIQDIDRSYSDSIMSLDEQKREEINFKEQQIKNDRSRLGGPQQELLKGEIASLRMEYDDLSQQYKLMINDEKQRYEQQVSALEKDTLSIKGDLATRIKVIESEIKNKIFQVKNKESQINKIRNTVSFDNKELKAIRNSYENKRSNVERVIESERNGIGVRIKELTDDIESLKKELIEKIQFFNQGLVEKLAKKESDLDGIRAQRMNLNIKNQLKELDNQEKVDTENMQKKIKQEKSEHIQGLQNNIVQTTSELVDLRSQKESLTRKLSGTTIGGQRQGFLDKKTKEVRRFNVELTEEQKKKSELIDKKQEQLTKLMTNNQSELKPRVRAHKIEIDNIFKKFEKAKEEVKERRGKDTGDFNRRDNRMVQITNRLATLKKMTSDYEAQLFDEGEKTLIGQWTNHIYGDMEPAHLKTVANVWFGSLAAITALLGTLLAFASMVLRYSHHKERKSSGITRAVQRYLAVARKAKRKPEIVEVKVEVEKIVEIIKEVPVTKIEIQEVPKEVIRKQIVHVPVASDDLTILDFNNRQSKKTEKESTDGIKTNKPSSNS